MQRKTGAASDRQNSKSGPKGNGRKDDSGSARPFPKRDNAAGGSKPFKKREGDNDRPFRKRNESSGGDRPFKKREGSSSEDRPFQKRENSFGSDRPFKKRDESSGSDRPFKKREGGSSEDKPFKKRENSFGSDRPFKKRDESTGGDRPFKKREDSSGEDRPFKKREGSSSDDRPFKKRENSFGSERPFKKSDESTGRDKPFKKREGSTGDDRPFRDKSDSKPFSKSGGKKTYKKDNDKPFGSRDGGKPFGKDRAEGGARNEFKGKANKFGKGEHPFEKKDKPFKLHISEDKEQEDSDNLSEDNSIFDNDKGGRKRIKKSDEKRPFKPKVEFKPFDRKKPKPNNAIPVKPLERQKLRDEDDQDEEDDDELIEDYVNAGIPVPKRKPVQDNAPQVMPLNKYIAHSGVCSRRDAAIIVKEGKVKVNNEVVLDPGHKVNQATDEVTISDKKLTLQKGMVYILLNKPKDYITTNEDPQGRKTVMDLLDGAEGDRLYPVGRLDRNTSGLLLITNDGDLAQKLAHPSYQIKKIYQVTLDKALTKADSEKIVEGIELEDGTAFVDALAYLENKNEIGLEIHSGKNRIVRRIFESLGYVVEKLDRMMYAGLTKKNLPRGRWRYLNEREVILLKHFK